MNFLYVATIKDRFTNRVLWRGDGPIRPPFGARAFVEIYLIFGKVGFQSTLCPSDDNLFLVTTALTVHAQFKATDCAMVMTSRGFVSSSVSFVFIVSVFERHDNICRINNGVVVQIFVEVIQAALGQGSHTTRISLLGGDEAE